MNLTDRQKELIEFLLKKSCKDYHSDVDKIIIFNGKEYKFYPQHYKIVCEIIDYIKGVKNNGI